MGNFQLIDLYLVGRKSNISCSLLPCYQSTCPSTCWDRTEGNPCFGVRTYPTYTPSFYVTSPSVLRRRCPFLFPVVHEQGSYGQTSIGLAWLWGRRGKGEYLPDSGPEVLMLSSSSPLSLLLSLSLSLLPLLLLLCVVSFIFSCRHHCHRRRFRPKWLLPLSSPLFLLLFAPYRTGRSKLSPQRAATFTSSSPRPISSIP